MSCGAAPDARGAAAATTVLSLRGLANADPGVDLAKRLRTRAGIRAARFDLARAEITVVSTANVDALAEATVLKDEDYDVLPGPGRGGYLAWTKAPAGTDVATLVADGADVPDLSAHTVPGKVTVFDFSAKWCEPCRALDTHLLGVLVSRRGVAYRKLEIVDWDSPLARHYLKDGGTLPYVVVFDASGTMAGVVTGLNLDRLDRLIAESAAR